MVNPLPVLLDKLPKRTRTLLRTCAFGLGAGVVTVAFQVLMKDLYQVTFVPLSHQSTARFLAGSLMVILASSLIVGWLLTSFCPEAAGSGIPQLKVAFWRDFGFISWRVVWVKFVAGVLSVGGGSSLGREGPSVQLAGGLSSGAASLLGEAKQNRRAATAAGAAAGLAAAFNTPLAAVTFVLEEIIQDLNSRMLGGVLLAAVLGALVVHGLLGRQPAFILEHVEAPSWLVYLLVPIVSALASVSGMTFQKMTLALRSKFRRLQALPRWSGPAIGGLVTWFLGVGVFLETGHLGVFGLGYDDLSEALTGHLAWKLAGILLATKLIATVACYGFGGCGGIFSPTLFLGAMSAMLVGGLFKLFLPLHEPDMVALAVVGMSACLGAVVRAPVTGILIVFELTHEFSLVPVLMLGSLVSQTVSYWMSKESFYDSVLAQDGLHIDRIVPPRDLQSWQQLPISAMAKFQPKILTSLEPAVLREVLRETLYKRFPVVLQGKLEGILTRAEAEAVLAESRPARLEKPVTCLPSQTIRELELLLIESPSGIALVVSPGEGMVIGLVTLHDLLRAQVQSADQTGD